MEFFVGFWITCAVIGGIIGASKNAPIAGFILGLLFGPLGGDWSVCCRRADTM